MVGTGSLVFSLDDLNCFLILEINLFADISDTSYNHKVIHVRVPMADIDNSTKIIITLRYCLSRVSALC